MVDVEAVGRRSSSVDEVGELCCNCVAVGSQDSGLGNESDSHDVLVEGEHHTALVCPEGLVLGTLAVELTRTSGHAVNADSVAWPVVEEGEEVAAAAAAVHVSEDIHMAWRAVDGERYHLVVLEEVEEAAL